MSVNNALLEDEKNSHRAVIFVLSQADQTPSDDALSTILENIKGQLNNGLAIIAVSTVRYQRGLEQEQAQLEAAAQQWAQQ